MSRDKSKILTKRGLTFIEIMITLSIFSVGFVSIFQVFFASMDRIERTTQRIYAHILLDNRLSKIERTLRLYGSLPFELNRSEKIDIGFKEVEFKENIRITEVEDYVDIFEVDLGYEWQQDNQTYKLSRSAYISDIEYLKVPIVE